MKPDAQTLSYLDRIGRVTTYIHDHLDEPLDLDKLCDVACLSRFHWHRIYRAMTGETAAQTVRRLKLARASHVLAHTTAAISEVAVGAGYTSQAAFSRAFAKAYGQPPATFRSSGSHASLIQATREENAMAFPIDIKTFDVRPALGLLHKGPNTEIGATYDKLFTLLAQEGLTGAVQGVCGTYGDDPDMIAPEDLRSYACVYVSGDVACNGLEQMTVGGGEYAVLHYKGPYAAMKPAYDWLYGVWLPNSGREVRDGPCIELNINTPDQVAPADLLTDILLPLQKET